MPRLFDDVDATGSRSNGEPLPNNVKERMKQENIAMGCGELHNVRIREIMQERERLKARGFAVPELGVGRDLSIPTSFRK